MAKPFKRVLVKLSGEMFQSEDAAISSEVITSIAGQLKQVVEEGHDVGIVVGGGNIFRGASPQASGMDRSSADHMGMLATVINSLALQDACEKVGVDTRVMSAVHMSEIAEPYIRRRAMRHLEKGRLVIFACGLGAPYFSTDTAAAQRALEIEADVILKATKVDGVYDKDPMKYEDATLYQHLDHLSVLQYGLRVMDATAISLCMDNKLPIIVFNLYPEGNIMRAVNGEDIGTQVHTA